MISLWDEKYKLYKLHSLSFAWPQNMNGSAFAFCFRKSPFEILRLWFMIAHHTQRCEFRMQTWKIVQNGEWGAFWFLIKCISIVIIIIVIMIDIIIMFYFFLSKGPHSMKNIWMQQLAIMMHSKRVISKITYMPAVIAEKYNKKMFGIAQNVKNNEYFNATKSFILCLCLKFCCCWSS